MKTLEEEILWAMLRNNETEVVKLLSTMNRTELRNYSAVLCRLLDFVDRAIDEQKNQTLASTKDC